MRPAAFDQCGEGTVDGRVLSAMSDSRSLALAVEYADGTSQTYNVRTADTVDLFIAIREVVPF